MTLDPSQLTKPLRVQKRIQETQDAVSLVLEIPPEHKNQFHYKAGQFVTFFLNIDGEELHRSYSLSSSPLVDQEFKVTVKKVTGGRGSTFLCEKVKEGDVLRTTPPAGHFFKPPLEPTHFFLFAAGSGITPVYSILKTVLTASEQNHVTLIYCNRNQSSIIYQNELKAWEEKYPSRLKIVHVLSQPAPGWSGSCGRLSREIIQETVRGHEGPKNKEFYLCGPKDYMSSIHTTLHEMGFAREKIHEEDFGIATHQKPKGEMKLNDDWTFIGPQPSAESPEQIIAKINGETITVPAREGVSLLETLLEAGAQPPYSCMDGACMACMGKIQEGRVYQEDPGILTDDNIAACEALTCQAKPLSRIVKVSYDDL